MSKAKTNTKTASKNNPSSREKAKLFFFNNQRIVPVKLITTARSSFFAAEYVDSGDLVMSADGKPLPWDIAKVSS